MKRRNRKKNPQSVNVSKLRQNSSSFLATKHIVKHAFLEHMKTNDVQPRAGSRVLNVVGCDFVGKLH